MLFTSYEFLLFVAVLIPLYYIVPHKFQWRILLVASYIFYSLAGFDCLAFIVGMTLTTYITSCVIANMMEKENIYVESNRENLTKEQRKSYRAHGKRNRLIVLVIGLTLGFGVLAIIKYTAFFVSNINSVINVFGVNSLDIPDLLLPMGISFYTFQSMGYLIDVYRGKTKAEKNPAKLALFISFFPQLIQGPISRFNDLAEQLYAPHNFDTQALVFGLQRILWGYFKKLVVADRMLIAVKTIISSPEEYGGIYVFLLIIFYSIEIYADFTGGIDITIGISEALGIKLSENFRQPFFSKSTKEYWRRWHITMGTWFSDYVFYPISVSKPMQKLSKKSREKLGSKIGKRVPVYLATLITWFLTGLWHGAGWNFIVWGILNAVIILISQELTPLYDLFHRKFPRLCKSKMYSVFMMARTFLLMGTVRILDCYRNVPLTFLMIGSIFTISNRGAAFKNTINLLGLDIGDYILVLLCCALMVIVSVLNEKKDIRIRMWRHPVMSSIVAISMLVVVVIFGAYGIGYDSNQFIYNQF